jgi:hypothetical protein
MQKKHQKKSYFFIWYTFTGVICSSVKTYQLFSLLDVMNWLWIFIFSIGQVFSDTKASKICQEVQSKRALAPDLNWALFQNVNGEIGKILWCKNAVIPLNLLVIIFVIQNNEPSCFLVRTTISCYGESAGHSNWNWEIQST